jgi:hypothetical protein
MARLASQDDLSLRQQLRGTRSVCLVNAVAKHEGIQVEGSKFKVQGDGFAP